MSLRKKSKSANNRTRTSTAKSGQGLSAVARKEVNAMLKSNSASILDGMKGLLAEQKSTTAIRKKKVASKTTKRKSATVDPTVVALKGLTDSIAAMNKSNRRSRRKGLKEQEDAANNGIPAKVLKDATDPDTVKFVMYAASHAEVHKGLSEDERHIVNGVYIQCMDAAQAGA